MDVSATGLSTAGTTPDAAASKLNQDLDTFLTLLTTQLKNQDPLQPTDSQAFVRQLTEFSQVEQSINTNKTLDKMLTLQTTNQGVTALSYIGNTVDAVGDTAPLQNGKATFGYSLADNARAATIVIADANGNFVTSAPAETTVGKHTFEWDGLNKSGSPMPPGNYTISVIAKNANDEDVKVDTSISAQVTGVQTGADGAAMLALDGVNIPLTDVLSVKQTPGST